MAATLTRAIESVLCQSYADWELIIVDNCSTDHPELILEKYSKETRISLYSISEKDRSKARNFGIEKSNGDYITFLDADDTLHPDYLRTYTGIFELQPDVIGISDLTVTRNAESYFLKKSSHASLPKFVYALNYGHVSIAGPKRYFIKYPFEGQLGEDRYLMAKVSSEANFVFTLKPYYIYNDDYIFASEKELNNRFVTENESLLQFFNNVTMRDIGEYSLKKAKYDLSIRHFYAAKFYSFDKLAGKIMFSELIKPYSFLTFLKFTKAFFYYYMVNFDRSSTVAEIKKDID